MQIHSYVSKLLGVGLLLGACSSEAGDVVEDTEPNDESPAGSSAENVSPATPRSRAEPVPPAQDHTERFAQRDAAVPPPPGPAPSTPQVGRAVGCELRMPVKRWEEQRLDAADPWVETVPKLSLTPDGGVWFAGNFHHEVDLGAGILRSPSPIAGYVHQVSADCKPVRTVEISPAATGEFAATTAVTTDPQGNVYVASYSGGVEDGAPLKSGLTHVSRSLVIDKLSPSGERVYRHVMPVSCQSYVTDLVADERGRLYASGTVAGFSNLGGGPTPWLPTTENLFLMSLDEDGNFAGERYDVGASHLSLGGDQLVLSQIGAVTVDRLALALGFHPFGVAPQGVTSLTRDTLRTTWSAQVPPAGAEIWVSSGLRAGGAVTVEVASERGGEADGGALATETLKLVRRDARGVETQRTAVGSVTTGNDIFSLLTVSMSYVHETASGGAVMSGVHYRPLTIGHASLDLPDAGAAGSSHLSPGAFIAEFDGKDALRSVEHVEWGGPTTLGALAPTPEGDTFAFAQVWGNRADYEIIVRKLRAPGVALTLDDRPQ